MSVLTEIQRLKNATASMKSAITAKGVTVPAAARISDLAQYIQLIYNGQQYAMFAVTDDISQYSSTQFNDVYDRATSKWYKLNNLNQFEEYGVYGTSPDDTKYVGKLITYNGNEYEWNGTDWRYLGEVTTTQSSYTYPEYIELPSANGGYIDLGEKFQEKTVIKIKHSSTRNGDMVIGDDKSNDSNDWRVFGASSTLHYDFGSDRKSKGGMSEQFTPNVAEWQIANYYVKDLKADTFIINTPKKTGFTRPCNMFLYNNPNDSSSHTDYGKIYYVKIYQDGVLVKDYLPWEQNGIYGLMNMVNMTFTPVSGTWNASTTMETVVVGEPVYPKYYSQLLYPTPPPVEVSFNTMQEALAYPYVYYGLKANVNGTPYMYASNEEWVGHTLRGTKVGNGAMSIRVNGTPYDVTVLNAVDASTYNWGYMWDSSVPITSITQGTNCDSLKTIDFGQLDISGLTSIGGSAFWNCTSLALTSLPSGITSIGGSAFEGCTNLALTSLPSGITSIGGSAFRNCTSLALTSLPSGVTSIGQSAFEGCTSLALTSLPSGITSIGRETFYWCTNLALTSLPSGVTSIGQSAFEGCTNLALTSLPSGVTSIGNEAFEGCTNLALTSLPSGLTSIGDYALHDCYSLALTSLPSGLTSISNGTFAGCTNLALTSLPSGLTSIGEQAFNGCTNLALTSLPSGLTSISNGTFGNCSSLALTSLPSGLTSIGEYAFSACDSLALTSLPSGITSIGNGAFHSCDSLALTSLPSGITSIGGSAFLGCDSLALTSLPSGITSIGHYTFWGCTSITTITIPSGLTSIGEGAFSSCSSMTSFTIEATTPPTLGTNVFANCHTNLVIYVPAASVDAYKSASGWSEYASRIQAIPTT